MVSKCYNLAIHLATNATSECFVIMLSNLPDRWSQLDRYWEKNLFLALNIALFCLESLLPMITVYNIHLQIAISLIYSLHIFTPSVTAECNAQGRPGRVCKY